MIPKPQSFIEKIADTQYSVIIEKGRKRAYTTENLFKIPKEYTVEGLGTDFDEYCQSLKEKGTQISLWKFFIFFRWELLKHYLWSFTCHILELLLLLILQMNLCWVNSDQTPINQAEGLLLFFILLVVAFFKNIGNFKVNKQTETNKIRYISVLGVNNILAK